MKRHNAVRKSKQQNHVQMDVKSTEKAVARGNGWCEILTQGTGAASGGWEGGGIFCFWTLTLALASF